MVRASGLGLVDFESADPRDPKWWAALEWALADLAEQARAKELLYDALHGAIGACSPHLDPAYAGKRLAHSYRVLRAAAAALLPLAPAAAETLEEAADQAKALYEASFGKIEDHREEIEATARALEEAWRKARRGEA